MHKTLPWNAQGLQNLTTDIAFKQDFTVQLNSKKTHFKRPIGGLQAASTLSNHVPLYQLFVHLTPTTTNKIQYIYNLNFVFGGFWPTLSPPPDLPNFRHIHKKYYYFAFFTLALSPALPKFHILTKNYVQPSLVCIQHSCTTIPPHCIPYMSYIPVNMTTHSLHFTMYMYKTFYANVHYSEMASAFGLK